MADADRSLTDFGKRVAEEQDRAPEARLDRDRGRARLLAVRRPEGTRRARAVVFALAAAIAGALLAIGWPRSREALRFDLGTERGSVGAWIAAAPTAAAPIRFSDGSRLSLGPDGRARVTAVDADGAEIHLERGALDADVVHRAHTRWAVRGGPFLVKVIGTRFTLGWDPARERLELALHEGAVTVSGPVVGDARAVRAGERLVISASEGRLEVGPIDAAITASNGAASAPVIESAAPALPEPPIAPIASAAPPSRAIASAVTSTQPQGAEEAPSWRTLAGKARHKDALAAAEADGFDALCASASASDLRLLGDVARLGGSPPRADQAFTALRRRFPGTPEAAAAAFIFGRAAQDRYRDQAKAAEWLGRYLAEAPRGEFAAEASGRLVEAKDKLGDAAGARAAAERYLAAYPSGAHAAYARALLARGAEPSP